MPRDDGALEDRDAVAGKVQDWRYRSEKAVTRAAADCGRHHGGRLRPRVRGKPLRCCARPGQ